MKSSTLSLCSPLRREGLYSLIQHAQKQYRYVIEHAPANFAFVAVLTSSFALLAFSKYWRAQIALFHAYTASVASAYWLLQSLPPLVRMYRRAQITPLTDLYCFIRFILLVSTGLPSVGFCMYRRARIVPLTNLYSICRFSLLISTVLPFAGLQVPTAQVVPLTDPYCISRLRILFFQLITFCFSPIQFLMTKAVIFPSGK